MKKGRWDRAMRLSTPADNGFRRLLVTQMIILALLSICAVATAETPTLGGSVELSNDILVPEGVTSIGDNVAILGKLNVLGKVHGNAVAIGGSVGVEGTVTGDVVAVLGRVTLGPNAVVEGDVVAIGGGLERAPGAQIHGAVNNIRFANLWHRGHEGLRWRPLLWRGPSGPVGILLYLFYLLGLYCLVLLAMAILPRNVESIAKGIEANPGRATLIGLIAGVLLIPVTVMMMITIIGIPVVFLLWAAAWIAKVLGYVAFVYLLGNRIASGNPDLSRGARLAIGVLVLGIVRYLPFVGALVSALVTMITVGAVLDTRFGTDRAWF